MGLPGKQAGQPLLTKMKRVQLIAGLCFVIAAWLSACNGAINPTTTAIISPLLGEITHTPVISTITPTALPITPTPHLTPAFSYMPDVSEPIYPFAGLRILGPGDGSRLTSPIIPELSILLGAGNTVEVELLNAMGELLVKKLLQYPEVASDQRILIHPEIDFEIESDEEIGRLVVKTQDGFGRLISLSSCDVILLSRGEQVLEAARMPYESFLVTDPSAGTVVRGGIVTVSGYARPVSASVIVFELVDEKGVEISNRVVRLHGDPGGAPIGFSIALPFQVSQETSVRLIVRQSSSTIPGPAVASSMLLRIK
jgi:hypothetical protein